MRLKKLHLHGYKTFANKTEFVFDDGITAIVGPNGSGKSNLADAVRWVMGEQSYTTLRGKKTDDMIFNGSSERARMGMAEAVLTLDNTDNWLPLDYNEVVIGRRAYRSGENEYFLNGQKVRLRDVQEVLDRSGLGRRTHLVIGQGLIDQALALRPEDRRELFEEAAGITTYRHKRRQTLEKLEQTDENLIRIRDIIAEISPRLRQLERQAERARQYDEISAELRQLLLVWYGYNWRLALGKLVDARAAVAQWQTILSRTQTGIDAHNAHTASLRERQAELRSQLVEWRRQLGEQANTRNQLSRDHAVGRERLRGLEGDRTRAGQERLLLEDRRLGEAQRLVEAEAMLDTVGEQRLEDQQRLSLARSELSGVENERRQTDAELVATRRRHLDFSTRLADRENRVVQAKERRQTVQTERSAELNGADAAAGEAARMQAEFDAASADLHKLGEDINALRGRHRETEKRRQELLAQRSQHESQRAEMEAQLRALRARFELLDRLRSEGEGLFAGVRQVMLASQRGQLRGVYGPMATLLNVPDRFEQAIEVALGGRIQDIVVAAWEDAETAIAHLKDTQGGRATFLPLDNLRPLSRLPLPRDPGVLGWAADKIDFDRSVTPAVELLLGQILVVTDLVAARRVSRDGDRLRIVTLEGDFVHPGGSVSGGSRDQKQKGGMLAREREWRSLPSQIEEVETHTKALSQEVEGLSQLLRSVDEQLTELVRQASALGEIERERTAGLGRIQSAIDRARQSESWRRERVGKLAVELENLGRQLAGLRQEADEFKAQQDQAASRITALEERLATLTTSGLVQAVAQAQARLDAIEATRRSQQALVDSHRASVRQTDTEVAERERRVQMLTTEIASLDLHLTQLQEQHSLTDAAYLALASQIDPAQEELDRLETGWAEHERQGDGLRNRLHQEQLQLNQAQLAQQRAEDQLTYLRSQIEHDFGLVSAETEAGVTAQEPLPFDQIVTALPSVSSLPLESEAEIHRLKSVLNRLGPINPGAQTEFAATQERHGFLTQQAGDLDEASAQLQKVIGELDQLMEMEFRRTFEAVAKAFTRYFTRLFGGGTAKLLLTDAADLGTTGVEIIARPPGKKAANLAMLSGGERSLTAAALIFSILSVSPTPFCVLDEVDAALDEANIGRVREVLSELAREAQFILITHNRGTIEAANTIYGISMGADSVSQALSLRLQGDRLEAAQEGVGYNATASKVA